MSGSAGGSIVPFLRWSAFGYGAVATLIAIGSWSYGEPPTWSVLAPRAEAEVVSSAVEEIVVADGSVRLFPRVTVRPPGSNGAPVALLGVVPTFYESDAAAAAALAAAYSPGETVKVRVIDGAAYADRTDGADLLHALFMSAAALVMLLTGFLIRPFRSDPTRPPLIRERR